jgi:hypothetical protein
MPKKADMPKVVPLFRRGADLDDAPEIEVGLPAAVGRASAAAPRGIDLAGPPCVFLIGPGKVGKSTFARWAGGRMTEAGRAAFLAALDGGARTLMAYFEGAEQPTVADPAAPGQRIPTRDPVQVTAFLRDALEHVMAARPPAMLDMGGNDTALPSLLGATEGLAAALEEAGVTPVALYFLGPRISDLDALAVLEARGFQPKATALVLNAGVVDATLDSAAAFAALRRHSVFRAAVERGALALEMPKLPPELAAEIERKQLHFADARDGVVPPGKAMAPIGGLSRAAVRRWMAEMETAFAPIAHWLP